jgi:hypothetical protein
MRPQTARMWGRQGMCECECECMTAVVRFGRSGSADVKEGVGSYSVA